MVVRNKKGCRPSAGPHTVVLALRWLRQKNQLNLGVQDQPEPHNATPVIQRKRKTITTVALRMGLKGR